MVVSVSALEGRLEGALSFILPHALYAPWLLCWLAQGAVLSRLLFPSPPVEFVSEGFRSGWSHRHGLVAVLCSLVVLGILAFASGRHQWDSFLPGTSFRWSFLPALLNVALLVWRAGWIGRRVSGEGQEAS